jgi:hypothetical protein
MPDCPEHPSRIWKQEPHVNHQPLRHQSDDLPHPDVIFNNQEAEKFSALLNFHSRQCIDANAPSIWILFKLVENSQRLEEQVAHVCEYNKTESQVAGCSPLSEQLCCHL